MQQSYENSKVLHHDRCLTVNFLELFDYPSCLVINASSKGIDWVLLVEGEEPEYSEYLNEPAVSIKFLQLKPEYHAWFSTLVLAEDRERLMQYPEIGFTLLWHISCYRPAYDLFQSNPTLLWMLLHYSKKLDFSKELVFKLISGKQLEILKAINVSNKRAAVTLLKNLRFESYYIGIGLNRILALIEHPSINKLNHHKNLDYGLSGILIRFPELIGGRMIYEYANEDWTVDTENLIKDSYYMINRFGDVRETLLTRLKQCCNHFEIAAFHDYLIIKLNDKLDYGIVNSFGLPPIKGTVDIQPVRDTAELVHEGKVQKNCVASYEEQILYGEYFVYRVIKPQRATLGLILDSSKKWTPKIDQLLLKCNRPVSYATREVVENWLKKNTS